MGRSLLFLVSGLTILTGIVQVNNQDRVAEIPVVTTDYYKAQQARNLSKSLIDNAVETMKDNNNWVGSIDIDEVVDTKALLSRSNEGRKKLSLGLMELDEVIAIEQQTEELLDQSGITIPINLEGSLSSYTKTAKTNRTIV